MTSSKFQDGLEKGVQNLKFSVLGWNEPSIQFYKSKGAIDLTESNKTQLLRISQDEIDKH